MKALTILDSQVTLRRNLCHNEEVRLGHRAQLSGATDEMTKTPRETNWALLGATVAAASRPNTQGPPQAPPAAADRFPETTGKAALLRVCSNCHSAESVVQSLRTRQEWSDVVDQMSRYGAEASDQEFDQILTYLVKHFSPIRINKATAKDLESTLSVPADEAAASGQPAPQAGIMSRPARHRLDDIQAQHACAGIAFNKFPGVIARATTDVENDLRLEPYHLQPREQAIGDFALQHRDRIVGIRGMLERLAHAPFVERQSFSH